MSPAEITEKLQLHKLKDHLWFVHPSCATTAEGLFEGLVSYSLEKYRLMCTRLGYRKMQNRHLENDYNWPVALVVDILGDTASSILLICFLLDFDAALLSRRKGM